MARADPAKGEATLGDKLLRMNFRAWRAFEHSSGKKLPHLMLEFGGGLGCDDLVAWVGAFLVDEADDEQVADIIEKAGHPKTMRVLGDLVAAYFGDLTEGSSENPPLAA